MNIDDIPVWPDHPWRHIISPALQVRRSDDGQVACMVDATGCHADFRLSPLPSDTDVAMMAVFVEANGQVWPAPSSEFENG